MSKKIMVVDDSAVSLEIIQDDLQDGGYEVIPARSTDEALLAIEGGNRPDVIMVDVMMPGMDGGSFCRLIKSQPNTKDIPVILVSMKEEKDIKVIIEQAGADGYLWKANVSKVSLDKVINKLNL